MHACETECGVTHAQTLSSCPLQVRNRCRFIDEKYKSVVTHSPRVRRISLKSKQPSSSSSSLMDTSFIPIVVVIGLVSLRVATISNPAIDDYDSAEDDASAGAGSAYF